MDGWSVDEVASPDVPVVLPSVPPMCGVSRGAAARATEADCPAGAAAGLTVGGGATGVGWATVGSDGVAGAGLDTSGALETAFASPPAAGEAGALGGFD